MKYNGIDYGNITYEEWDKMEWYEVNYYIGDNDFTADVKAKSAEHARQLLESQCDPICKVWSVYSK